MSKHLKFRIAQHTKPIQNKLSKTIKILFVLSFLFISHTATANAVSQFVNVKVKLNNPTVADVIDQIHKQTGYEFSYDASILSKKVKSVSVDLKNEQIENVIGAVFNGTGIGYKILNNRVFLKDESQTTEKTTSEKSSSQQAKQAGENKKTISGTILDASGQPVIGANIIEKGSASNGTITNANGSFTLTVNENAALKITCIGYEEQTINTAGKNTFNIVMQDNAEQLSEVVVVGYGTQKKVNLSGAVATLDAKKIADRPTSSIMRAIQGSVPGVTVISRPGSTSLNIRGRGNLGASDPLYVVDGVEVSPGFFNAMDPNSIENISFLKDASSAAIYGAKAAFGVILVTTKSAKAGQLQVAYDGSYGSQSPTYLPKVLNSASYAEMYRTAEINSGVKEANLTFNDDAIAKYRNGSDLDRYPNSNWFDLVLRKQSLFTKHNLQFTGGSEKIKYTLGLGYLRNETLTPGEGTDRYSFTSKTSSDFKKWLTVTSNVNFIYDKYNRQKGAASLVEFLRVPPTQTARQSTGEWGSVRNGRQTTAEEANYNPLRSVEENGRANSNTKRLLGSIAVELRPMEGLKITNQLAYNYTDYRGFSFQNKKKGVLSFLNPTTGIIPGTASDVNQMNMDWNFSEKLIYDGWANYDRTFNKVHAVSLVAGVHADTYLYKRLTVGRKDFASNDMNDLKGGSTDPKNQLVTNLEDADFYVEEAMNSYFGRIGYTYAQKYIFEANFRADASSRFAKSGRWGYFPSVSAAWRVEQENFMKNVRWIDGLKLRGSWGRNGNINNVGSYDTYSTYSTNGTVVLGGVTAPIMTEGRIGNPNLTWETTTTTDFGMDLILKNGLLGLTVDYYNRLTTGILVRANDIMTETGLSTNQIPARNVGRIRNSGLELILTHTNKIGDVSYNLGFNTAINKNEIIDLGNKVDQLPPNSYWIMRKGGSIGDFYMLEADGLYSTEDIAAGRFVPLGAQKPTAGMIKYVDQLTVDTNGDGIPDKADGIIDDKDRTVVGNDVPKITYGLNMEVNYKNFTLSVMGQGVSKVKVYMDNEASQAFFDNSVPREWQLDNWTPENQGAAYPKLFVPSNTNFKYNSKTSSYWLFDASYFRVKNITLSYNVPSNIIQKAYLKSARIYLSGDNLFTFRGDKRMKDFDPEAATGRGYQIGLKAFTVGLSVTL